MDKITTQNNIQNEITVLPNQFIDEYMIKADGEYVKIYLLILRMQNMGLPVEADRLADRLELTRKDVLRALSYWEKAGLLKREKEQETSASDQKGTDAGTQVTNRTDTANWPPTAGQKNTGDRQETANRQNADIWQQAAIQGNADNGVSETSAEEIPASKKAEKDSASGSPAAVSIVTVPQKSSLTPAQLKESIQGTDLERTVFAAEAYLGRPLSSSDLNSFCYITDRLRFSSDLLEYLIEYCVTRGKKSVRYIESVAISWYQQGITTVKEAREQSVLYTQNVFPVMKAFGLSGRDPGSAELNYIKKWNSLNLGTDIIIEACSRTLLTTHQASFPYANKILEEWKRLGVRSKADIRLLDEKRRAAVHSEGYTGASSGPSGNASGKPGSAAGNPSYGRGKREGTGNSQNRRAPANQFHNFEQRIYDYNDLESRLLDKNRR